jgi:endonuclease/exonuclease/phosphatase family metal-dependent hydrolase
LIRITVVFAYLYPLLLLLVALWLRFLGEQWWFTMLAMYLPRLVLAVPLVALVPALIAIRRPSLLWTQLISAGLLLFPILGFVLPSSRAEAVGMSLRVLSYNVHRCEGDQDALAETIAQLSPDVVLLQEVCTHSEPLRAHLRRTHAVVRSDNQFLLASRFPLLAASEAPRAVHGSIRYELDTPLGRIGFYSVHPTSPRVAFRAIRHIGVRKWVSNGEPLRIRGIPSVARKNFDLRQQQLTAAAELAATDTLPVVIAGDTNLPGSSATLHRLFGIYREGFNEADWGFGYTFPSRFRWMRLDRMFASQSLRFSDFRVGCGTASDHCWVLGDITRDAPL